MVATNLNVKFYHTKDSSQEGFQHLLSKAIRWEVSICVLRTAVRHMDSMQLPGTIFDFVGRVVIHLWAFHFVTKDKAANNIPSWGQKDLQLNLSSHVAFKAGFSASSWDLGFEQLALDGTPSSKDHFSDRSQLPTQPAPCARPGQCMMSFVNHIYFIGSCHEQYGFIRSTEHHS